MPERSHSRIVLFDMNWLSLLTCSPEDNCFTQRVGNQSHFILCSNAVCHIPSYTLLRSMSVVSVRLLRRLEPIHELG